MGRLNHDQGEFFYSFRLDEAVPDDHPVRAIAAVLDLSWVHAELAPFYPKIGRPSIDPVLMIRMLIVGYAFAIRSERFRITQHSHASAMSGSVRAICSAGFSSVSLKPVLQLASPKLGFRSHGLSTLPIVISSQFLIGSNSTSTVGPKLERDEKSSAASERTAPNAISPQHQNIAE